MKIHLLISNYFGGIIKYNSNYPSGHTHIKRITLADRDEQKKKDREQEKLSKKNKDKEEEYVDRSQWCKYSLGLKHQIWKLKGEEYRIVHGDGWQWVSGTRVYNFLPQEDCGLRAVAKKLYVKRQDMLNAKVEEELSRIKQDEDNLTDNEIERDSKMELDRSLNGDKDDNVLTHDGGYKKIVKLENNADSNDNLHLKDCKDKPTTDDTDVKEEKPDLKKLTSFKEGVTDVKAHVFDSEKTSAVSEIKSLTEEKMNKNNMMKRKTPSPITKLTLEDRDFLDTILAAKLTREEQETGVLNVSEAIRVHRHYVKTSKPHCKLDQLLERRQKQWLVEQRQKVIIDQVLLKYRVQNLQKKKVGEVQKKCNKSDVLEKSTQDVKAQSASSDKISGLEEEKSLIDVDDHKFPGLDDEESQHSIESVCDDVDTEPENALPYQCYSAICRATQQQQVSVCCFSAICSRQHRRLLTSSTASSRQQPQKRPATSETSPHDQDAKLPNGVLDDVEKDDIGEEFHESVKIKRPKLESDDSHQDVGLCESKTNLNQATNNASTKEDANGAVCSKKSIIKDEVTTVAKINPDGKTFVLGDQEIALVEQTDDDLHKLAKKFVVTIDNLTFTNIMHAGKLQLTPAVIPELELKRYMVGKTQYQLTLHRFAKGGRNANKGRFNVKRGIPPVHRFITKSGNRSLFVLDKHELYQIARREGKMEVKGFKYECKMNNVGWNYPCPRPQVRTCWRYRCQNIQSLAAAALQFRILWACLRWDDLTIKPPQGGQTTVTSDDMVTTTEVVKCREVGTYNVRSEYLVRKIIVPLNLPEESKRDYTPIRSGLRERKRADSPKQREPSMNEVWMPEEKLQLWEIKCYWDKQERSSSMIQEKVTRQLHERQSQDLKQQQTKIEEQLKQQRLAMQQKRLNEIPMKSMDSPAPPVLIRSVHGSNAFTKIQPAGIRVVSSAGSSSVLKVTQPMATTSNKNMVTRVIQSNAITAGSVSNSSSMIQLPSSAVNIRPKLSLSTTGTNANNTTVLSSPKAPVNVQRIAPSPHNPGDGAAKTQTGQVQNLKIMQLPNGQLQVQGLLPGQQLLRQPNGKLQLITAKSPATPSAASPKTQLAGVQQPVKPDQSSLLTQQLQQQTSTVLKTSTKPQTSVDVGSGQSPATPSQQAPALTQLVAGQKQPVQQRIINIQMPGRPTQQVLIPANQIQTAVEALQKGQAQIVGTPGQPGRIVMLSKTGITGVQSVVSNAASLVNNSQVKSSQSLLTPQRVVSSSPQQPQVRPSSLASQLANANPVIVRTPSGQLGILRPNQPGSSTTQNTFQPLSPPAGARLTLSPPGVSPTRLPFNTLNTDGSKTVDPNVVHQVLQRAMMQSEDPDIQAKIQAYQRNLGSEDSTASSQYSFTTATPHSNRIRRQRPRGDTDYDPEWSDDETPGSAPALKDLPVYSKTEPATKTKTRWPRSKEDMEDQTRQAICSSVLKQLIDKIEKREKAEVRAQRKSIATEEKREKQRSVQLYANLYKHKESLKTDMMKKRALMEKTIHQEIQTSIKEANRRINKKSPADLQKAVTVASVLHDEENHIHVVSPPTQQKRTVTRRKRQRQSSHEPLSEEESTAPTTPAHLQATHAANTPTQYESTAGASAARKKRKTISTGGNESTSNAKLYCICKSPYDDTKFYVGCDLCSNWFHGKCIGISENAARYLDSYVCDECKVQAEENSELYCICRTPYDDTQFYIGCDHCNDWFHGSCVGLTKAEADSIDTYLCPRCQDSQATNKHDLINQVQIKEQHWDRLSTALHSLQSHKMSWPFHEPVDGAEVPDYYQIIKEPMGQSCLHTPIDKFITVEKKLDLQRYVKIGDFMHDIMKIFDNCRLYNPPDSPFYKCAEVLEAHFVQTIKTLEQTL